MIAVEHAETAQDIANVLLRLNDEWQKCESLKKKKTNEIEPAEEASGRLDNETQSQKPSEVRASVKSNDEDDQEEEFFFGDNQNNGQTNESSQEKKEEDNINGEGAEKSAEKRDESKINTENESKFDNFDESVYKIRRIPCTFATCIHPNWLE